jgi:PIN domain nuclease of toxin-antitoxin system
LWLALDPGRISVAARDVINDPTVLLGLSPASVLEIVLKHRAGKLPMPESPAAWIPTRRAFFSSTICH